MGLGWGWPGRPVAREAGGAAPWVWGCFWSPKLCASGLSSLSFQLCLGHSGGCGGTPGQGQVGCPWLPSHTFVPLFTEPPGAFFTLVASPSPTTVLPAQPSALWTPPCPPRPLLPCPASSRPPPFFPTSCSCMHGPPTTPLCPPVLAPPPLLTAPHQFPNEPCFLPAWLIS